MGYPAKKVFLLTILILLLYVFPSQAALTTLEIAQERAKGIETSNKESWIKEFGTRREEFTKKYGTSFAFLFNYDQQWIVRSKENSGDSGAACYWNVELMQELWPGASIDMEFETDRGKGVDKFLPTFSILNTNSGDNIDFYIPRLYFQQDLVNERVYLAAGKLDLSDWFDYSVVAGCGDTQFTSSALVNNPIIPFPAKGLGAMVTLKPYDWLYFQSGASTAKANSTKTGLSDGFNSTFFINELGFTPKIGNLEGNYRFIFHLTHEKLERFLEDRTKNNTVGFALSFDQAITERLTLFLRYGFDDPKVNSMEYFWSFGGQLSEPFPGRKYDYLGLAVAQSITGKDYREYNGEGTSYAETICELYYSYNFKTIFTLTPNIQMVIDPDANKDSSTAVVMGLRLVLSF